MRTNVVIDDELLTKAMQVSKLPTKRAVIEAGLQALIRLKAQENIRSLRGKLHWEGDLEAMRTDHPTENEDERQAQTVEQLATKLRQQTEKTDQLIDEIIRQINPVYSDDPVTQEAE